MVNSHPPIKIHTFDVLNDTKPTDQKSEGHEFTFKFITRWCSSPNDQDELNKELETRMQEQEMNQSGPNSQNIKQRTMYIHRFYPTGGRYTDLPLNSRYSLIIQND